MPRTGRGGPRDGKVGAPYPNRSDLRGYTGQPYGMATQQAASQAAVPVGPAPSPPPVEQDLAGFVPTSRGAFTRPTENTRPVTHGLPSGPGAGPEVLQSTQGTDNTLLQLQALYRAYPSEDLRALIEVAENG